MGGYTFYSLGKTLINRGPEYIYLPIANTVCKKCLAFPIINRLLNSHINVHKPFSKLTSTLTQNATSTAIILSAVNINGSCNNQCKACLTSSWGRMKVQIKYKPNMPVSVSKYIHHKKKTVTLICLHHFVKGLQC